MRSPDLGTRRQSRGPRSSRSQSSQCCAPGSAPTSRSPPRAAPPTESTQSAPPACAHPSPPRRRPRPQPAPPEPTNRPAPPGGARLQRPPTLRQRPEQVQLERQQRPPSAATSAELCCPPSRAPAGGLGRRTGSQGVGAGVAARRVPPRPPRARQFRGRRAAAGHRGPCAPGHAARPPPRAPEWAGTRQLPLRGNAPGRAAARG